MNLYHMYCRFEGLRDNTLYTLNDLKLKHPDLHALHVAKYDSRQHVLKQRFSCIDCDWGDAVFLCSVHPDKICAAVAEHRKRPMESFPYQAIPVADLDQSKLAFWLFQSREFEPNEVIPFDQDRLKDMQDVPDATAAYFAEQLAKREPALFFVHIPHVLHKGSIDMRRYPMQHTSAYEA